MTVAERASGVTDTNTSTSRARYRVSIVSILKKTDGFMTAPTVCLIVNSIILQRFRITSDFEIKTNWAGVCAWLQNAIMLYTRLL